MYACECTWKWLLYQSSVCRHSILLLDHRINHVGSTSIKIGPWVDTSWELNHWWPGQLIAKAVTHCTCGKEICTNKAMTDLYCTLTRIYSTNYYTLQYSREGRTIHLLHTYKLWLRVCIIIWGSSKGWNKFTMRACIKTWGIDSGTVTICTPYNKRPYNMDSTGITLQS